MSKRDEVPYYRNIIQLMALAVFAFLIFKMILPERLFPEIEMSSENIVVDSLMIKAIEDSTSLVDLAEEKLDDVELIHKNNIDSSFQTYQYTYVKSMNIEDGSFDPTIGANGHVSLARFYTKLEELSSDPNKKVRMAYFGDSMNDGDFIVQDIRALFQERFGGRGVGFVGITSLSGRSRATVLHDFSDNWTTESSVRINRPTNPFGIDGQVFFANNNTAWVEYKAHGRRFAESLYNPILFYGRSDNTTGSVKYTADETENTLELTPQYLLNRLSLGGTAQKMNLEFMDADSIPLYGVNFDNGKGIHIDNFSLRGNSGLPLSILNTGLMNAFDRVLNYDLIVLQYGTNVLGVNSNGFGWYERNMSRVVQNLRNCFPNADILIVSTADKAKMINGVMQTDPSVVDLAIAQRNYAKNTDAGFINLYQLMGGEGSMVEWVEQKTANKDYTHFNAQGSLKIGSLLFDEIMRGYDKFLSGEVPEVKIKLEDIIQE